jgi:iron complex outermembrane receptor protein
MSSVERKNSRKKLVAAILSGLAAQAVPMAAPVFAAEAQRGLEEIIVTSRRTEEALQDVPLSITALSQDAIERSSMQNFADLQRTIPSLNMVPSTGRKTSMNFSIRGQRVSEITTTVDPSVGLYMAEVPVARPQGAAITGFLDVGSVEVLKGPQGTLFGRNTTGGAIIVTPNAPEDEFGGSVGLGLGDYNREKVDLMLNAPITDKAAARIALTSGKRDGVLKNRTPGLPDTYDEDYIAGRGSFRWHLTDALSTTFYGDYLKANDNGGAVVLTAVNPALPGGALLQNALARQKSADFFSNESSFDGWGRNEIWGVSNTTTYEINDNLSLKNVLGYRQGDTSDRNDFDGAVELALGGLREYNGHQISEELQLQGDFDRLTWTTGLFWFKEEGEDFSYTWNRTQRPTPTSQGTVSGGDSTNTSYSVFGQGTYALTDALNLTVGLRWTKDKRELDATAFSLLALPAVTCQLFAVDVGTATVPGCVLPLSKSFSSPTWNVSLDYKLDEDQLVYVATRRGYRTGGFSARPSRPLQAKPFDPETVTDYEIGYKGDMELAGRPLRLNAAAFYADYEDVQRSVNYFDAQTQRSFNLTRNAANATVWGGELEVTWLPTDSLEFALFYGRIHARFDEAEADNATGTAKVDLSGNRFATTPEHKGGLTARYQLPFGGDVGEFSVQASAVIQSEIWTDATNRFDGTNTEIPGTRQSGYTVYDARIDWDKVFGQNMRISLWGKNLTDTEYFTGGNTQYNTLGFNQSAIGEPRTYGVDVKYNF